jgi:hypothetical protein
VILWRSFWIFMWGIISKYSHLRNCSRYFVIKRQRQRIPIRAQNNVNQYQNTNTLRQNNWTGRRVQHAGQERTFPEHLHSPYTEIECILLIFSLLCLVTLIIVCLCFSYYSDVMCLYFDILYLSFNHTIQWTYFIVEYLAMHLLQ